MSVCTRPKGDGTPCHSMSVRGFPACYFHLTDEEFAQLKARQDAEFDLAAELRRQLKLVRNTRGNTLDKARLILDITKALRDLEGANPTAPEAGKPETPQEYARRLRGK